MPVFWNKDVCPPFVFPAPFVLVQTRENPFIYGAPGLNAGLALRDFKFLHHACACKLVIPVVSSKSSQCRLYVTEIVGNCPEVYIKQILIGVTLTNVETKTLAAFLHASVPTNIQHPPPDMKVRL